MKKQKPQKKLPKILKEDPEKKHIDEENYGDDENFSEEDFPEFIDEDGIADLEDETDDDDF